MAFITPFPSFKTALGIAKETVAGTFVVSNNYIPIMPPKVKDEFGWYEDKSFRNLAAETYGHFQLVGKGGLQFDGPFYPDSCGYHLYATTGIDTVTAKPSNTTTTGTNSAGATSLTVTAGTGYANQMSILIDTGTKIEGATILSGGGTATLTLYAPLRFTHTAGATVSANTLHALTMGPTAAVVVPTFSLWDFYGENQRQWSYGVAEQFELKWNVEKEVTYAASWLALPSILGSAQTIAPSTVTPFTGWMAEALIAGSVINNLEDLTFTAKRKVLVVFAGNNQNTPVAILPTTLGVSGKMIMWLSSEAELNHYRNADNPSIALAMFGPSMGTAQSTQTASGLVLQMTNAQFTLSELVRTKEAIEVQVDWASDYSATDAGVYEAFLTNSYTAFT